jgi:hypothetical protein
VGGTPWVSALWNSAVRKSARKGPSTQVSVQRTDANLGAPGVHCEADVRIRISVLLAFVVGNCLKAVLALQPCVPNCTSVVAHTLCSVPQGNNAAFLKGWLRY